jgi:hypothetical protein
VSDEWEGLMSKVFLSHFGERMSSTFPQLKRLTLIWFNLISLTSFLDCLENLSELSQLDIRHLSGNFIDPNESWSLLHRIFTVNNNRLSSVSIDDDSTSFSIENKDADALYPNIVKLSIKLKTLDNLHDLLTMVPRIQSLDIANNQSYCQSYNECQYPPVYELKEFCLRSIKCSWDLEKLASLLNRMPNVEKLSIYICTFHDFRLVVGHEFFAYLSSLSLRVFKYVLLFFQNSPIDQETILYLATISARINLC